jgi:hypothetical protein
VRVHCMLLCYSGYAPAHCRVLCVSLPSCLIHASHQVAVHVQLYTSKWLPATQAAMIPLLVMQELAARLSQRISAFAVAAAAAAAAAAAGAVQH